MVEIQVYGGNGINPDVITYTDETMRRYLASNHITMDMMADVTLTQRGFYFVGYTSRERGNYTRPWNVLVHNSLGFDDSTFSDMITGACYDAARLFEDCGAKNVASGTKGRDLAGSLKADIDGLAPSHVAKRAIPHLFLHRRKATAKRGTSIMMGWWGIENFMGVAA